MNGRDMPCIPVSWGELLDKLTILEIKSARIASPGAHENIEKEHRLLRVVAEPILAHERVRLLIEALRRVNDDLWEIEDAIRASEALGCFDAGFVALARSVYHKNDLRAAIKRDINRLLCSALVEEKSYADFAASKPEASTLTGPVLRSAPIREIADGGPVHARRQKGHELDRTH